MPRATFKLFRGRSSNPIGTASFFGRSHKAANATGRRYLRNIAAGFYDDEGIFHPLRASYDYSAKRAGEGGRKRSKAKPKRRRR